MSVNVGVLALQGAVTEHLNALHRWGAEAVPVRRPADLDGLDGLVLPGGESTAMSRLLRQAELVAPIQDFYARGKAILGTCAGLILSSNDVQSARPDDVRFGFIPGQVQRNGFGRQVDSFEADLTLRGCDGPVRGVFIRAPYLIDVAPEVDVLCRLDERIVAAAYGRAIVCSFHPELTDDGTIYRLFYERMSK